MINGLVKVTREQCHEEVDKILENRMLKVKEYMKPSTLRKLKEVYGKLTHINCLYLEETDELIESYNKMKWIPENLTKFSDGSSTHDSEQPSSDG